MRAGGSSRPATATMVSLWIAWNQRFSSPTGHYHSFFRTPRIENIEINRHFLSLTRQSDETVRPKKFTMD